MAWFDTSWSNRLEVAVPASGSGSFDITITIGSAISRFWDHVLSTGNDIRVTYGDGVTEVSKFQRQTWNYAAKSAVIQIQAFSAGTTNAAVHQVLIYFGNSGASDAQSTFTASSAKTGYVSNSRPRAVTPIPGRPEPGTTIPRTLLQKASTETVTRWFDANSVLARAVEQINGRSLYEEIAYVTLDVKTGGSSQASMFDTAFVRFVGRSIRVQLKAGSSGTNYVVILAAAISTPNEPVDATTAPARIEEVRVKLIVQDPAEA